MVLGLSSFHGSGHICDNRYLPTRPMLLHSHRLLVNVLPKFQIPFFGAKFLILGYESENKLRDLSQFHPSAARGHIYSATKVLTMDFASNAPFAASSP